LIVLTGEVCPEARNYVHIFDAGLGKMRKSGLKAGFWIAKEPEDPSERTTI